MRRREATAAAAVLIALTAGTVGCLDLSGEWLFQDDTQTWMFSDPDPFDPGEDGDRVRADLDNCPDDYNLNQVDTDGDGTGDRCESPLCPGGVVRGSYEIWSMDDVADLAGCSEVIGDVWIADRRSVAAIELPGLVTIGGFLAVTGGRPDIALALSLPALRSVGGSFIVQLESSATSISLPELSSIGGDLSITYTSERLTTVDFPQLTSVGGILEIQDNYELTSLGLPNLASVGGDVWIYSNRRLPQCAVQALLDQLLAAGWTATPHIAGNDDAGVCP